MKRSLINRKILENMEFLKTLNFYLPSFAYWSPEEWEEKGPEHDEIKDNMLGWDITDFGRGAFENYGLVLFTLRNGNVKNKKYKKPYAEKILICEEGQKNPIHFHWNKMEDIINRGGGILKVQVWGADGEEEISDEDLLVNIDGSLRTVKAGSILSLMPGESITITPYMYHHFWAEEGKGKLLLGEVSMVNDDNIDNRFANKEARFPTIEEDEKALYYLCNEYPK